MKIKLLESDELEMLTRAFSSPSIEENKVRFEKQQKGEAAYIIAIEGDVILGKVYLKYTGSNDKEVFRVIHDCPDMENLEVIESEQGKGVGTKIIQFAEKLCLEKGFKKIGLGVANDNKRAKGLYEHLGYREAVSPFVLSFPWKNKDGQIIQLTEEVVYLVKEL